MLKKLIIGVAALALMAPASMAFAHQDEGGSFFDYFEHDRDHADHRGFHDEEAQAHAEAHERGFYSPDEHARWHGQAEEAHQSFHERHPTTWHDHRDWESRDGYGYPSYRAQSYSYDYPTDRDSSYRRHRHHRFYGYSSY